MAHINNTTYDNFNLTEISKSEVKLHIISQLLIINKNTKFKTLNQCQVDVTQ